MASYIFGGDTKETPESIKRKREIVRALMGASRAPQNVGEGLNALGDGIVAAVLGSRADKAEAAGRSSAADAFNSVFTPASASTADALIPKTDAGTQISATDPNLRAAETPGGGIYKDFIDTVKDGGVDNPYALAAIAATGRAESGFDPAKANARWADPSQSGKPGTSGGILSWRNERLSGLEDFARAAGEDPSQISAATQAKYLLQEDPALIESLKGAKSVEEAQSMMNNAWKFAGYDQPSKESARRLGYAQEYLPTFQATETASLDPSVGMPTAGDAADTEWLRYANSGATRNQPISGDLQSALSFLPEMGVQMEVFSGGQPGKGENGARVGSTRHDHGGAADVFFYKDGRKLDWNNPEDVPVFQEIVRRGKANGVTGFGAGDGYMQPGSMHIGFGNPGVWGSGGRGANAADWLRSAYEGASGQATGAQQAIASVMPEQETVLQPIVDPGGVQVADAIGFMPGGTAQGEGMERARAAQQALLGSQGTGQQTAQPSQEAVSALTGGQQVAQNNAIQQQSNATGIDPRVLQALSNEYLSDSQRGALELIARQQMQEAQAQREQKMKMADPAYQLDLQTKQAQLDALRNPERKPIEVNGRLLDPKTLEVLKDFSTPTKRNTIVVNGRLVDAETGQEIANFPDQTKPTSGMQEYDAYAADERAAGREPLGRLAFEQAVRASGASQVNIDQKAEGAFDKKLAEKQAETFSTMADEGVNARSDIAVIDELDALLQGQGGTLSGVSGMLAKYGIGGDGVGDVQAAQALINKLVPTQRQAGSGTMSDRDVELFTRSLPSLWNSPGGNEKILNVMRGLAQYRIAQGEIANSVITGDLGREEGRRALAALPNPLEEFRNPKKNDPADGMPMQGQVVDGYRYKGGDPADPNSWEQTQ